jgi:methionyl aminopeptidase
LVVIFLKVYSPERYMNDWIKAGDIAKGAREYGRSLVVVGANLLEVTEKIEDKIFELGGKPAFPAQLSINSTAAHYNATVGDETEFKEGDLIKLDVGVHVNGAIGDTACTIDLGNNSELVKASEDALAAAIELAKPGVEVREIGDAISKTIRAAGFSPIKNLGGHGLAPYSVHTSPSIPNFNNGDTTKLKAGEHIAIEPFATDGEGTVVEGAGSEIYLFKGKKPVRDMNSRKILTYIETEYNGLPFAKRWLTKKFRGVNMAFTLLERAGAIYQYPRLVERKRGMVAQTEHSLIVGESVTTK